ncbi:hypothetical protein IEQ34_014049 [Dendrobium chrysotoxum]|uniref:Uncharacterized protein n=1 Tax=Dendrobium chrysotoxum TaxID=161865 RepID=A0AAV7GJN4_DENCH|nr:hypothetical protein IEQ34_014049 [Dendrobium chrysotoxum]
MNPLLSAASVIVAGLAVGLAFIGPEDVYKKEKIQISSCDWNPLHPNSACNNLYIKRVKEASSALLRVLADCLERIGGLSVSYILVSISSTNIK